MNNSVSPAWDDVVRLRLTSANVDPTALELGRDLVLDAPRAQACSLPLGVLLDDLLSAEARAEIDERAILEFRSWRERRDGELTIDGVCLPHIWEVELLAPQPCGEGDVRADARGLAGCQRESLVRSLGHQRHSIIAALRISFR